MALVTTAMAGVLLRLVYPPARIRQDLAARDADTAPAGQPSRLPEEAA
jgi:hypothetical protein